MPATGQPDVTQMAEYYRSLDMARETEMIELQQVTKEVVGKHII